MRLLAAAGLKNRTPATFVAASENGNEPRPGRVAAVLDMIAGREVAALLVNPRAPTAATDGTVPAGRSANAELTGTRPAEPTGTSLRC